MRYPASEKLEIIRLVEQSHLGVGSTLDKLGIPKTTFYRWCDRFLAFGDAGLEDRNSSPGRVWNRYPSSKQMGLLSVFHKGGSGSSLIDVKPLGVDGSSGGFGWSVF